ncbi:MAG: hypothetical protein QOE51_1339 [Actinoplanes sp.]|jgi:hypothetical protein|nr:hypothetical protein [Actinoplanes sp.]
MESFHRRLARIAFDAGDELGLVLAGGYAVSAHHLTDRPSRDLDFATASLLDLPDVATRLSVVYEQAGYRVSQVESTSRMARLAVTDGQQSCEVDLLKEAIGPPVQLEIGPVLTLDDAVGLKMRALHDRAAHRDFIDVHAAATRGGYTYADLERVAAVHTPHFASADLADRLEAVELRDDRTFYGYGLDDAQIAEVRRWALGWATDIRARPHQPGSGEGRSGPDWDAYLEE